MNLGELVILALKLSVTLLVFSLGLRTDFRELGYLLRRPGQLLRTLLAMNVLMPLLATGLALALPLSHGLKVMLVAVALSPVPPLLPRKQAKAGGRQSYAIGLLFAMACFSIVTIPVAMELLQRVFGAPLRMPALTVAQIVFQTVLLPLGAGLTVRALAPAMAERIGGPLAAVAGAILPLAALALLVAFRKAIASELSLGAVLAIAAFVVAGLTVGHLLGGPDPSDRTVLALSAASRHPGMALAIATANFPEKRAFVAALFLYLITAGVLSALYQALKRWREGAGAGISSLRAR